MKEIIKVEDNTKVIQTIDDNSNLVKIDIDCIDPDNTFHFIGNYEYNSDNLLSRYYDNDNREVKFDFDKNKRLSWKRMKYCGNVEMSHYIYKDEDSDEIIKVEHQYGDNYNSHILIGEFIDHSAEEKTEKIVVIETDDLNRIKPFIDYSKMKNIDYTSDYDYKKSYKYVFNLTNETDFEQFKILLRLDNIKGVE